MLLKLHDLVDLIAPEGRIRQIQSMNNQPVLLQISTINFPNHGIVRIMNKEHNLLFHKFVSGLDFVHPRSAEHYRQVVG